MSWITECNKKAKALPIETRQKVLDGMHSGLTIGNVAEINNITTDEVVGIININMKRKKLTYLNKETV